MLVKGPILGQEAITSYGLGRVTQIFTDGFNIGVTPYVAKYQMNFAKHNVQLVELNATRTKESSVLTDFVRESNKIEDIHREPTTQEVQAHKDLLGTRKLSVGAIEHFVSIIQPGAKLRRSPDMNVQVGIYIAPPGGLEIEVCLNRILASMSIDHPYNTYISYEVLHPFTDGNGRSGRALWFRQMGGDAPGGFLPNFHYQALQAASF